MNKYVDLRINGRLFPSWVVANFRKFYLSEIKKMEGTDPCKSGNTVKDELKSYQIFISKFLDFKGPFRNILLYYGVGAGKTGTSINIYNVLYNYTPGWNVFILIKASLKQSWLGEIKKWLKKDEFDYRFRNIVFVNYDSPFADRSFMDAIKNVDNSKKSLYIIDEVHNFIRNVYSNISSDKGKRAQTIYEHIIQDQKENIDTRVIALSATPAVNHPFELALLFNLLRPNIFPKSETEFNTLFVSTGTSLTQTMNTKNKNLFQRRILGLVSYYYGSTPDVFATKTIHHKDVPMSSYHEDMYNYFEEIEDKIALKMKLVGKQSQIYKSYTRQACNFVFPALSQKVNGENRPRPSKFKLTEREAIKLQEGKTVAETKELSEYTKMLNLYISTFETHLLDIMTADSKKSKTIFDDINTFIKKYDGDYDMFYEKETKSGFFEAVHKSSCKMIRIIFMMYYSKGPICIYSNYVYMEGIQLIKVLLKLLGFYNYMETKELMTDKVGFVEFHGGIKSFEERAEGMRVYNTSENRYAKHIKVMLISPAGSEGLSLRNVRQIHILEPYWNEVRIEQIIGRGIRFCSHSDLPIDERRVDVYRYNAIRAISKKITTDQYIEDLARTKESLIQSFLDAVKETAIDCSLNKNHNMLVQEYKCFQFEEQSLFNKHIGPAYKDDIYEDIKYSSGSNSPNSSTIKIKVMKIKAVTKLSKDEDVPSYSDPVEYWYYSKYHTVYDLEMHFPIGKIQTDDNNIPVKLNNGAFIINYMIPMPYL